MKCLFVLLLLTTPVAAQPAEDRKLAAFFDAWLERHLKEHPVSATAWGDHSQDARMDDLSPAARLRYAKQTEETLEQLAKQLDYAKLSRSSQIDFKIFEEWLKRSQWEDKVAKPLQRDPRAWNGYIVDTVFGMLSQSTVEKSRGIQNAAGRIQSIPKLVNAAKETLADCPRIFVETAIKQNRGSIDFYQKGIFDLTGETPQVSVLAEPCKKAVAALQEYQSFLENVLLPKSQGDWRIGKDRFEEKLKMELDLGFGADELYQTAIKESDRVRNDMAVIARQLWATLFPGKPLPPEDAEGKRWMIHLVLEELGKNHGEAKNIVGDARKTINEIKKFIEEKRILTLPSPDRCDVIEMPEFQRGFSTAYLNPAPPLDPKAKSLYAVSPPPREWNDRQIESYLREYNSAMLKILTIHEGYPGHYVQLEYANRHPSKLRRLLDSGVFAEGWAVYTEQMMLDQGFGNGDLSMRLHQLKWYLRAVTNTILDHRMHCLNLNDADAKKLLMEEAFQTEGEALGKITRAKLSSCQLSTYFAGRVVFHRLRQEMGQALGDKFDLLKFHEAVLSHGTLPVKFLPELVKGQLVK